MIEDDRLPWFPCIPTKLLGALAAMKPDQQIVYVIVLLRIYEVRGPCPDSIDALARRIGINKRRVTEALASLFQTKRLTSGPQGLMNEKAGQVIARGDALHQERARAGARGGSAAAEKRKEKQSTPPSKATANGKHLHLEQDSLFPSERGVQAAEPKPEPKVSATPPLDPEAELYVRGKAVLGKNAGGMIRNLLAAKNGVIPKARAVIEEASTKADPREYVGGAIRGGVSNGRRRESTHGAAALLARMHEATTAGGFDGTTIDAEPVALPAFRP